MLGHDDYQTLVAKARDRIINYPKTHDQTMWFYVDDEEARKCLSPVGDEVRDLVGVGTNVELWNECGTTACVAGHLVAAAIDLDFLEKGVIDFDDDISDAAWDLIEPLDPPGDLFDTSTHVDDIVEWMDSTLEVAS